MTEKQKEERIAKMKNPLNELYGINIPKTRKARKNCLMLLKEIETAIKEGSLDGSGTLEPLSITEVLHCQKHNLTPTYDRTPEKINFETMAKLSINQNRIRLLKGLEEIETELHNLKLAVEFKGKGETETNEITPKDTILKLWNQRIEIAHESIFIDGHILNPQPKMNADGFQITQFEDLLNEIFDLSFVEKDKLDESDKPLTKKQIMKIVANKVRNWEEREWEQDEQDKPKKINSDFEMTLQNHVEAKDELYVLPDFKAQAKENTIKAKADAKIRKTLEKKAERVGITYEELLEEINEGYRMKNGVAKNFYKGQNAEKELARSRAMKNMSYHERIEYAKANALADKEESDTQLKKLSITREDYLQQRKKEMKTETSEPDC